MTLPRALLLAAALALGPAGALARQEPAPVPSAPAFTPRPKPSREELKRQLTPLQFEVT